jgi:hypothetical protein
MTRDRHLTIRVGNDEHAAILAAVQGAGVSVSELGREIFWLAIQSNTLSAIAQRVKASKNPAKAA